MPTTVVLSPVQVHDIISALSSIRMAAQAMSTMRDPQAAIEIIVRNTDIAQAILVGPGPEGRVDA